MIDLAIIVVVVLITTKLDITVMSMVTILFAA